MTGTSIESMMQIASEALARMDYLTCEDRCLEAMAMAKQADDWSQYARILLPLQEARRQRRMIAAEGVIRLGTADSSGSPAQWLTQCRVGCVVVTQPHDAQVAQALTREARAQRLYVEVLWADNTLQAAQWAITTHAGMGARCVVPAPPRPWVDRWLEPESVQQTSDAAQASGVHMTPADWFLDACEALGDAALARIEPAASQLTRIDALERCLTAVTDHEVLHQELTAAARAMLGHACTESA